MIETEDTPLCGIAGLIGNSKNPCVSYALITSLFDQAEVRGEDAAGFWGCHEADDSIIYHKEPIKSSEMVKKEIWKKVKDFNPNLLLVHARGASMGVGMASINRNNHPFSSADRNIGLVHNGRIPDSELDALKKKYEVVSRCDSEMFLRIFESGETYDDQTLLNMFPDQEKSKAVRLAGLKDIWSSTSKSYFAVAIGERLANSGRRLWLFRNKYRSLWLIDLRKELGQVFFCSTPEIWQNARDASEIRQYLGRKVKLLELPTEEIWSLTVTPEKPILETDTIDKIEVVPVGGLTLWEFKGNPTPVKKNKPELEIITKLGEDEEPLNKYKSSWSSDNNSSSNPILPMLQQQQSVSQTNSYTNPNPSKRKEFIDMQVSKLLQLCKNINETNEKIKETVEKLALEGQLSEGDMELLMNCIEEAHRDLMGSLKLLEEG